MGGRLSKDDIERMVREAEQFADEEKFKNAIDEAERKTLEAKVDETTAWLETAEHAEKEEFESMQKDLEAVCNPIITKMYQSAGGAPEGGMPGGMPGADGGAAGGPTIEEVD